MENDIEYNEACIHCGNREYFINEKRPSFLFGWAFGLLGIAVARLFRDKNNIQYDVMCKECGNVEVKHFKSEKHS